jgi:3-hydroxyisobutyrate dehydrogenase-like beta-hydroxyacid dehydrogenase
MRVGLLHPGEMGAAIGAALRAAGRDVLWASEGRSEATAARAQAGGLDDAGTVAALAASSEMIVSVCPPHAATEVANAVAGFEGIYVDANAVASATVRALAEVVPRLVDGGIVGPPPTRPGTTRLYLSGPGSETVASLFAGTAVDARVLGDEIGAASALKAVYAAWTKGTAALLLAVRAVARAEGVESALLEEWALSQPELEKRFEAASSSASAKGWRWVGEMREIAATFAAAGLPAGFHEAAAEVFERPELAEPG